MRHPTGSRIETHAAAAAPIAGDKRRWWVSDITAPGGNAARVWTPGSRVAAESRAFNALQRLCDIEQNGIYEWPANTTYSPRRES